MASPGFVRADSRSCCRLAAAGLVLAVALSGLLCLFPVHEFDVWWHLKTGELIVTGHGIPKTDPFSYTAHGRPWITHEWLAEVLFYGIHRLGGVNVLVVFKAVLAALAIGLGAWAALLGPGKRAALAATALGALLAGPMIAPRAFERPHMLTAVFLGLVLVLLRAESLTGRRRWRTALIPLFLLWANIHSGFVLGLGLILAYWFGEAISPSLGGGRPASPCNWRERFAVFAAACAAALINPHHIHAFLYPFHLVARREVTESIVELRSIFHPSFASALFLKALAVFGVTLGALLIVSRRQLQWAVLIPGLVFGFLAVRSVRGVSEFAVLVPLLIGAHGTVLGAKRGWSARLGAAVVVLSLAGGAAAVKWGSPMGTEPNRRVGLGVNPVNVPDSAVRFLQQERPEGQVFNFMGFGGYLIHEMYPDKKVYIDGRLDVYPPGFLEAYVTMVATGRGWDEAVEKYGITTALVTYADDPASDRGLRARLRDDPAWRCVFVADNALIYARDVPANADILARYSLPFDPSLRSMESLDAFVRSAPPADLERTLQVLERICAMAPDEKTPAFVLGQLLDRSGRSAEAVQWFGRALRLDPSSTQTRLFLVGAMLRSGSLVEARSELESLLRKEPDGREALVLLADLERAQGRPDEAARVVERALAADPRDYELRLRAGAFNAECGQVERARFHFEEARKLRPGDPAVERNLGILERIEEQRRAGGQPPGVPSTGP